MWDLISGAQLDEYLDQGKRLFLVDMRDARAYCRAHIRGAVNIPYGELRARIGELPQESLIVLYCDHNADFWERYFRVMISAEVFVDKFMGG